MTKRNRDALAISDGACNPVAIVNSMVAAIAEMRAAPNFSGRKSHENPLLRLRRWRKDRPTWGV